MHEPMALDTCYIWYFHAWLRRSLDGLRHKYFMIYLNASVDSRRRGNDALYM